MPRTVARPTKCPACATSRPMIIKEAGLSTVVMRCTVCGAERELPLQPAAPNEMPNEMAAEFSLSAGLKLANR